MNSAQATLQSDVWFRNSSRDSRAGMMLVCLPHAGGGASTFRDWQKRLPGEIQILAVQYPGHEGRWQEKLSPQAPDIAGPLAAAIAARLCPNVALYGHSLGAFIAFEVARTLRQQHGIQPRHLFVSGSRAPDVATSHAPLYNAPDHAVLKRLRELGGMPEEVLNNAQLMDLLLPILRCDLKMDETYCYSPEPALECPITAFVGEHDEDVSVEQVRAWRRHTQSAFKLHVLPAGHWWPPACEAEILSMIARASRDIVAN